MTPTLQRSARFLTARSTSFAQTASKARASACTSEPPHRSVWRVAQSTYTLFSFTNAMAAVRRVLAYEHQFQLVITRVLHEGEDQLLDEDEESAQCVRATSIACSHPSVSAADHERAFLIGPQLEFREDTFEGEPSFVWRDLESAEDLFEFVARGTNALTMTLFQTAVSKAIYERVHTRSSENATEDELAEFIYK